MDIISLPVEYDKNRIDGKYRLVVAISRRARMLCHGTIPKLASKSKKMTTVALEEVTSNALKVLSGEEAVKAMEISKKLTYETMMDEAKQKESLPEDLTELEKDLKVYLHEKEEKENTTSIEEIFPDKGSE
jgi:DNA-directed RNA polymerase subunit omega